MTRLALVDLVDGVFRLLARAEAPSSLGAPPADVAQVVIELAGTIATVTGRELVKDGQLLVLTDGDEHGVGSVAVTTSAAGLLPIVITALSTQQSTREAMHAAHGSYSVVEQIFSLGEGGTAHEMWLGQQVAQLGKTKPDVVLIAGGLEGGAVSTIQRLGHVVGLLARTVNPRPHIIYAGNSAAADMVRAALGDDNDVQVVANLRPRASSNRLEPTRAALRARYNERVLPTLPGYATLRTWQTQHIGTVAEDQGIIVRFLAERFGRNILALDIGATHSSAHLQADGHYSEVILANLGTGFGAARLLEVAGSGNIGRWLPFPIASRDLVNRLLNRMAQPYSVPADVEDLLIDHALVREAFREAVSLLRESRAHTRYDLVIGGGAIARAPRPGLAALSLLDALALDEQRSHVAIDLYLDTLGLLPAGGALAHIDPDAAASMIEQDGLNNGPLATVIVPHGTLLNGHPALDVELTQWVDGQTGEIQTQSVRGGQIARLPFARGQRGTLRIKPAAEISIGNNASGAEVLSDEGAISGSALGIIIDARPRPLALPEDEAERRALLLEWLAALDALPGAGNEQTASIITRADEDKPPDEAPLSAAEAGSGMVSTEGVPEPPQIAASHEDPDSNLADLHDNEDPDSNLADLHDGDGTTESLDGMVREADDPGGREQPQSTRQETDAVESQEEEISHVAPEETTTNVDEPTPETSEADAGVDAPPATQAEPSKPKWGFFRRRS